MLYKNVRIESFGYELPETVVTSQSLEERVAPIYEKLNLSYGRFEMMTGIRERRFWDDETTPSQASTKAAEKAIAKSGIDKEDIECLLHTSVCRDFLEPATATLVHDSLGLPGTATIFDISNACLGFANGMVTLANMIELGQVKAGIVVGAEGGKRLIDRTIDDLLKDPTVTRDKLKVSFASLTLGSGAVAVVLTRSSLSKSGHKLLGGAVRTASEHNDLCRVDKDTYFYDPLSYPNMSTDYTGILNNGVALAAETWKAFQRELGWREPDVGGFFTHQVSTVHQQMLFHTLELDESKCFSTVEYLGNIASCSLPISLAIGIEEGRVNPGDRVVMMAAGSGLCVIVLGLEW
ncbi:MAG: 3-oxoacyl-ACP synthase III [Dehalococcoidia bacterium]|nr:MAG: 3-oxoacyl-ACP synthase III [Dehalococcoidia bacterium]